MIQESEHRPYRGVACLHCRQPIPVSPLIAGIEAEGQTKQAAPHDSRCQIFHLRCPVCGKEKPYKIAEIIEFQGSPATLLAGPKAMRAAAVRSAQR